MKIDYSNTYLPKHEPDQLDVTSVGGSYIVSCQYEELSAWKTNVVIPVSIISVRKQNYNGG